MKRLAVLILAMVVLHCCARPSSFEQFIRTDQAKDGAYIFDLFMSDSSQRYDLSFFLRVDAPISGKGSDDLKIYASWLSPADTVALCDTVWLRYDKKSGARALYRSGVRLGAGWKLKLVIPKRPDGFGGIGVICTENGTR